MNKCDTCKYAEWEWSEIKMIEICTDCTLGFRNKFESEDDCGRYSPSCEAKMTESEDKSHKPEISSFYGLKSYVGKGANE